MHVSEKHSPVKRRLGAPKLPAAQLEHKGVIESGDVRLTGNDRCGLIAQPIGRIPIVVVPVCDYLSSRLLAREGALCPNRQANGQMDIVHVLEIRYKITDGIVTIIDNHQLLVRIILSEE